MSGSGLRAGLALLCVFAVGVVAGVLVERLHSGRLAVPGHSGGSEGAGPALHAAAMRSLEDALHLDSEQVAEIHQVFEKHQGVVHRSWEAIRPSLDIAMEKMHGEIAELLTEDQRKAFHAWMGQHGGLDAHRQHLAPDQTPAEQ